MSYTTNCPAPMPVESEARSKRLFVVLSASVLLVLAATSTFVAYTLYQSRVRYFAESASASRNLAMALENGLQSHFTEVELALKRARIEFSSLHGEGRFSAEQFSRFLRGLKERIPQANAVRGTDANGMVVYGEDIDPAHPQDLKIREFYQRALTERDLIFGIPVKSRISGDMVFPLIYAMTDAEGRFGGTAYVSMNTARIDALMSSLELGEHGVIALVDTRHHLLHRYPELAGRDLGVPIRISPITAAFLASGEKRASFSATSALDKETRLYSIERIGTYPVYVLVGLSERDVLAAWNGEVRNGVAFLLVLYVLSAALLRGVHLSLRRQRGVLRELFTKENVLRSSVAALTQSEARFRSLTEGLPQMVWTTGEGLHFDFLSHHWSDYTGVDADTLRQQPAFHAVAPPEERVRIDEAWALALADGIVFRCACRIRRHDGVWRVFDNHGLPQRDDKGAILCWVGSSTDITEQRDAHDAMLAAKDQALAAGRAKSEFLANMSHEIRSPMNAVLGMLQLLQRTPLQVLQRDYAAKAETSARALLGILNDILDYSKVEEGKLSLDPQPFSFDKLLRGLAIILSANASGKEVEVLFNVSPEVPRWVVGDELRLQQVLLNLAGNAIKFTERGQVVLSVAPLHSSADSIDVHFSIRDTGIGIAPEHLEHIFDGFSQAEASTARRFGGTGLGLAISQRLVRLMNGVLNVTSVPGQGSTFEFAISMGRTGQPTERPFNHRMQYLRCLIVDDNVTGRMVLAEIARSFGWRADCVASGEEALGAVSGARYDLVLIDWRMPGMDGLQASEQMRTLIPADQMPSIVMVTAYDRELIGATRAQFAQVLDAMLAKPITASMLFDTVSDLKSGGARAASQLPALAALAQSNASALTGVRLLLVDDNAMNQQVARELLRACGAEIEVADCGQAAIDAVCGADAHFDLVLMDIQMPDMDGYATTAVIQSRLGGRAPPVIAMTANAMASDREAARAAGMVDHVGKPFDLDQLIGVIQRHVAVAKQAAAPAPELTLSSEAGLNTAAALARLGGNLAVYQLALRGFEEEMDKLTPPLAAAMIDDRPELAGPLLHTLKGLAGMVGADRLFALVPQASSQLGGDGAPDLRWAGVMQVLAEVDAVVPATREAAQLMQEY